MSDEEFAQIIRQAKLNIDGLSKAEVTLRNGVGVRVGVGPTAISYALIALDTTFTPDDTTFRWC